MDEINADKSRDKQRPQHEDIWVGGWGGEETYSSTQS